MLARRVELAAALVDRRCKALGIRGDLRRKRSFGDADRDLTRRRVDLLPRHFEHRLRTGVEETPNRDRAIQLVNDRRARGAIAADQDGIAAANQGVFDGSGRQRQEHLGFGADRKGCCGRRQFRQGRSFHIELPPEEKMLNTGIGTFLCV